MLPIKDLPEYLDPAAVKRCYESRLRSERLLYLAICPDKDRELLKDETTVWSLEDFKRITDTLSALELSVYCDYLQMKHSDLLEQVADGILAELNNADHDIEKDIKEIDRWRSEFCNHLPTETMKKYIGELLYTD